MSYNCWVRKQEPEPIGPSPESLLLMTLLLLRAEMSPLTRKFAC